MDDFEKQMADILQEFSGKIDDLVEQSTKEVAEDTVRFLKANSPKSPKGGQYARSWTKKKDGKGMIVYNKKHYQLTHLLEFGHVIKNQFGSYAGRTTANDHIARAEKEGNEKYVRIIKRGIGR